ncbi:lccl domain containing protein [Moniliophthora roreri]|nr:lccl domain containing protein [Moniliophthora roreri]
MFVEALRHISPALILQPVVLNSLLSSPPPTWPNSFPSCLLLFYISCPLWRLDFEIQLPRIALANIDETVGIVSSPLLTLRTTSFQVPATSPPCSPHHLAPPSSR